jgi:hypothetical protein
MAPRTTDRTAPTCTDDIPGTLNTQSCRSVHNSTRPTDIYCQPLPTDTRTHARPSLAHANAISTTNTCALARRSPKIVRQSDPYKDHFAGRIIADHRLDPLEAEDIVRALEERILTYLQELHFSSLGQPCPSASTAPPTCPSSAAVRSTSRHTATAHRGPVIATRLAISY